MYAGAIDEQRLTVEHKAFFGITGKRTNAIVNRLLMDDVSIFFQFRFHFIAERIIRRPQFRVHD